MVDTEKIHELTEYKYSEKFRCYGVLALEREIGLNEREIISWRMKMPETKKLFLVANEFDLDVNDLLIFYDPEDKNTIILNRAKENYEYFYGCGGTKSVYEILCKATGRRYIGSSVNADKRLSSHASLLSNHNHLNKEMQKDYDIYGSDSFEFRVIGTYQSFTTNYLEYFFMYYYKTKDIRFGYNFKDNHGSKNDEFYRELIPELKQKANAQSITIEELLNRSKLILRTIKVPKKRKGAKKNEELTNSNSFSDSVLPEL